jgi:hypothetical protein
MSWEAIVQEWRGIGLEAIAEAVTLASKAFLEHAPEYTAREDILEAVTG